MRIRRGRALWLVWCVLGAAGITLAADRGHAQRFEYVITFDKVVVDGIGGPAETPALAHLDLPTSTPNESSGGEKPPTSAPPKTDQTKKSDRLDWPPPNLRGRVPDSQPSVASSPRISYPPGLRLGNPTFIQEGFLVEAFWAVYTGTNEAFFARAHFHPPDLSTGFEAQHLGHPKELHGIFIQSLDGKRFGLKSLQYRVTRNRQIPHKPISIEGFSNYNVNVLVARSFDPRAPIRSQFTSFPVGLPMGNELTLPWFTLRIFDFELVDRVYIGSSASVDFDNIVLTRREPPPALLPRKDEDR